MNTLQKAGWEIGGNGNSRIITEYRITKGRISKDELWERVYSKKDDWRDRFNEQHFYSDGTREPRYYQEIAINRALKAIADGKKRLLLTLATVTGKTFIAFQICYKLFQCKWNVKRTGNRPRILFLTDRNILANQAYLAFNGFSKDALVRITPDSVRKNEKVPTNGSVFFTIFRLSSVRATEKPTSGNIRRISRTTRRQSPLY